MALRKNNATVNAQAEHLGGLFNGGTMQIYTGSQPSDPNSAVTGTLLVTIILPNPAFGSAVAGVISKAGTWSEVAIATGTAGYARLKSSDNLKTLDVSVSESGGGGNAIINDDSVVSGNTITVTSFTFTSPAS